MIIHRTAKRIAKDWIVCDSGVTAVQYGLIAALVGTGVIGSVTEAGQNVTNTMMRAAIAMATGGDMNPLSNTTGNGGLDTTAPRRADGRASWAAGVNIENWESSNGMEVWADGFLGLNAIDGDTFVELDGASGSQLDAYHTDVPTIAGQPYTLTFHAAQRGRLSETVQVLYGGEVVGNIVPTSNQWQEVSIDVVGTGDPNTRITFQELASENNSYGVLLDGVSLTESNG